MIARIRIPGWVAVSVAFGAYIVGLSMLCIGGTVYESLGFVGIGILVAGVAILWLGRSR